MNIPKNSQLVKSLEQNLSSQKVLLRAEQATSGAMGIWLSFDTIELCDGNFYEASLLSLFHFWLQNKNNGKWFGGFQWIYKSAADLVTGCLGSLSQKRVARILTRLVDKGLLIRDQLHFEVNDDYAWANRTYYYRINYSAIAEFVLRKYHSVTENRDYDATSDEGVPKAETYINPRLDNFVQSDWTKTSNQIGQNCPMYNTKNTSTKNNQISNTLPLPPQSRERKNNLPIQPKLISDPSTEPLIDYWQSDQFFNKAVEIKSSIPSQLEPRSCESSKAILIETSCGAVTQKNSETLQKDCRGPWASVGERDEFYRQLVLALPKIANARVPQAVAKKIIRDLENGEPSSYWEDFVNKEPIGSSTKRPWEVNPGEVNPMFVNFLVERMKRNGADTNEKAANDVFFVLNDYKQANYFWQEFKRIFVQQTERMQQQRKIGVRHPDSPVWMRQGQEPTVEQLEAASEVLAIAEVELHNALNDRRDLPSAEAIEQEARSGIAGVPPVVPTEQEDSRDKEYNPVPAGLTWISDELKQKLRNCTKALPVGSLKDKNFGNQIHVNNMSLPEINEALKDVILRSHLEPQLRKSEYFDLECDRHGNIENVRFSSTLRQELSIEHDAR